MHCWNYGKYMAIPQKVKYKQSDLLAIPQCVSPKELKPVESDVKYVCQDACVEVGRQLVGAAFLLPPYWSQGWNSGRRVWWQALYPQPYVVPRVSSCDMWWIQKSVNPRMYSLRTKYKELSIYWPPQARATSLASQVSIDSPWCRNIRSLMQPHCFHSCDYFFCFPKLTILVYIFKQNFFNFSQFVTWNEWNDIISLIEVFVPCFTLCLCEVHSCCSLVWYQS